MKEVFIKNKEETKAFARELEKGLVAGDVVALIGDLGTGKTALTKYIAHYLGIKNHIKSPTFNIVLEYHDGRIPLYHFDLYRLDHQDDLYEIGYEDCFYGDGVSIVEWADIAGDLIPKYAKIIYIEHGEGEEERIYKCTF